MLNKEFVPYEQAMELKDLGFDEPCFGCYTKDKELSLDYSDNKGEGHYFQDCSAPLYQQAFAWFREKYNIHPIIQPYYPKSSLVWNILFMDDYNNQNSSDGEYEEIEVEGGFETAELSCLEKIIQIIKNKKL